MDLNDLLRQLILKDKCAWEYFQEHYHQLIRSLARAVGLPHEDAEDLCQDVDLLLLEGKYRFNPEESKTDSFRAWLTTVVRNRVRDWFRRKGNRLQSIVEDSAFDQALTGFSSAMAQMIDNKVLMQRADEVVKQVANDLHQRMWMMKYHEQQDSVSIAAALNVEPATVWKALHRLRTQVANHPTILPFRSQVFHEQGLDALP